VRRLIEGGTKVSANGRTLGLLLSKCENKNNMIALLKSKRGRIPPALPGLDVDAFWANCADLLWTLRPFSPAGKGRRSQGVRAEWLDTRMGLACSEPMMSGDPLPLWERSYTVTEQEACLMRSPGSLLSRAITPGAGTVLHLGPTIWLGSWCPQFANCDLTSDGSGAATTRWVSGGTPLSRQARGLPCAPDCPCHQGLPPPSQGAGIRPAGLSNNSTKPPPDLSDSRWQQVAQRPWFALAVAHDFVCLNYMRHQATGHARGRIEDSDLCLPPARSIYEADAQHASNALMLVVHSRSSASQEELATVLAKFVHPPTIRGLDLDSFWLACSALLWTFLGKTPLLQPRWACGRLSVTPTAAKRLGDVLPIWERSFEVTTQAPYNFTIIVQK